MGSSRPKMPSADKMPDAIEKAEGLVRNRLEDHTRLTNGDWMSVSECLYVDSEIFFAPSSVKITHTYYAQAYEICRKCKVSAECLAEALMEERNFPQLSVFGVRGGLIPRERVALAMKFGVRGGQEELMLQSA